MRHRAAAAVLGLALAVGALAGCGGEDITKARFSAQLNQNLRGRGVTPAQVTCISDAVYDQLSQSDVNVLFKAEKDNQVPDRVTERFTAIAKRCTARKPG